MFAVGARVAADEVELSHGHVKLGFARVVDLNKIGRTVVGCHGHKAAVAAHAVGGVHDRIALGEFAHVADDCVDVRCLGRPAPPHDGTRVVKLAFGD